MTDKPTREECRVATELALRAADGSTLQVSEVRLWLRREEGKLSRLVLQFLVPREAYEEISRKRLFHLEPEVRGPLFGGEFEPGRPIEIEARLADERLAALDAATEDAIDIAVAVVGEPLTGPLRATESYYAMYVKQQHAFLPVKTGYQTSWGE